MESTATNLETGDVPKVRMKKKTVKRKMNIKIRDLKEYATTVDRKGIRGGIVRHGETAIIKNLKKQKEPLMETEMSWCCVL